MLRSLSMKRKGSRRTPRGAREEHTSSVQASAQPPSQEQTQTQTQTQTPTVVQDSRRFIGNIIEAFVSGAGTVARRHSKRLSRRREVDPQISGHGLLLGGWEYGGWQYYESYEAEYTEPQDTGLAQYRDIYSWSQSETLCDVGIEGSSEGQY